MAKKSGFNLSFDVRNAAFDDGNRPYEAARILREIADKLEAQAYVGGGHVRDVNGNTIGHWEMTPTA
jgi:hypothetical protein